MTVCSYMDDSYSDHGKILHSAAAGLKVLRDNNLIHRDLKPQVSLNLFIILYGSFNF